MIFSSMHWEMPGSTLNQKIRSAHEDYYTIKAQKDCQDTWLSQLINVISAAKDNPKAQLWKKYDKMKRLANRLDRSDGFLTKIK